MKKPLMLLMAFAISLAAFAQHHQQDNAKQKKEQTNHSQDHIMRMDGKMMVIKNGKTTELDKDIELSNGSTVSKNGMVHTKDGKMMTMKNGDMIYMDGKMGKMQKPVTKKAAAKKTSMQKHNMGKSMALKGC